MPNDALKAALKEAYASAPADDVIIDTLELRHPTFLDDNGDPMGIYVVRDHVNITARLEDSAPLNAGQLVEFESVGFDVDQPTVDTAAVPEITVIIDNVSRELMPYLDKAATGRDKIEVTYRPYLDSDLESPQMDPPITLTLSEVKAGVSRVTARARLLDVGNKAFPGETYMASVFRGLVE